MPAKARNVWVVITAAGRWEGVSQGMTAQQRMSSRPRMSTPPDLVSSSPLRRDDTHVNQQSSTAACTYIQSIGNPCGRAQNLFSAADLQANSNCHARLRRVCMSTRVSSIQCQQKTSAPCKQSLSPAVSKMLSEKKHCNCVRLAMWWLC